MRITLEHEEQRRNLKRFIDFRCGDVPMAIGVQTGDPRDTRNVIGCTLSICKDGDARTVRPVQFGVARP